jgi:VWFA-related protein
LVVVALVAITGGGGYAQTAEPLSPRHEEFLEEVTLLITEIEREAFLAQSQDHQRDRFVDRFWRARDPFPQSARNEFRDVWNENAESARARFGDLSDHRAQMILFFGEEKRTFRSTCSELLAPIEIWYFGGFERGQPEFAIVFRRARGTYTLWNPYDGLGSLRSPLATTMSDDVLATAIVDVCSRGDQILAALSSAADWKEVRDSLPMKPRRAQEWVRGFLDTTTDIPEGAQLLPAEYTTGFPGAHQSRTVAQLLLTVPHAEAAIGEIGGRRAHNFLIDGEILLRGELFDTFRYKFDVPEQGVEAQSETIPLVVERYLRPGAYTWIVKLRDLNSDRFFRLEEVVQVPNPRLAEATPRPELAPPVEPDGVLEFLSEANASLSQASGDHMVEVWAPTDRLVTGTVRVEARTTGEGIARVAFDLDGKQVMAKSRPPYSIEINLGRAPRLHRLQARVLDAEGNTLARDELMLNAGPHRFAVRLIEPQRGHRYSTSVRANAEVEVPEGETLDRVEFFLNETLVATVYQRPFIQPIAIPQDQELGYVRAIAYLADGNSSEDLTFVNSPHPIDEIQVDLVELYTSVFDQKGRPVEGLEASDFRVREDRKDQEIRRFEAVAERPFHAGILLDTSTSMIDALEEAEKAALRFFEAVLRPRDRACLITFNDRPELVVPFTNQIGVLAGGLAGLVGEGETALHDSLLFGLHYFSGLRGKRVLILLSDGEDVGSSYTFDEVLEFAHRTGVAIYTIGLDTSQRDVLARNKLLRLAAETGGRAFFIESAEGLDAVYAKIEAEIRAQYLLAYQSPQVGDEFRNVELDVLRPGLRAKTLRGYYP